MTSLSTSPRSSLRRVRFKLILFSTQSFCFHKFFLARIWEMARTAFPLERSCSALPSSQRVTSPWCSFCFCSHSCSLPWDWPTACRSPSCHHFLSFSGTKHANSSTWPVIYQSEESSTGVCTCWTHRKSCKALLMSRLSELGYKLPPMRTLPSGVVFALSLGRWGHY